MLFTSYNFILFLIAVLVIFYIIPRKYQWIWLLIASYVFYGLADIKYLLYISITSISTYVAAIWIGKIKNNGKMYINVHKAEMTKEEKKSYKARIKKRQRVWFVLCLLLNFGILGVAKYTNFVIGNINNVMNALGGDGAISFLDIALPLGISFYTFKTMSYLIDVYRDKYEPERNMFKLMLFTSFFPQLIQGPISKYDDLSKTLLAEHDFEIKNIQYGLIRILWGFFKKLVIADRLLIAVNEIVRNTDDYQGIYVLVGMVFYGIELYADFTGGIDITIGISEMMGIKVQENFIRPYFSKNITEYWRRWHITMGQWFREYLFYPISVSKPIMKLTKKAKKRFGNGVGRRVPIYISTITLWFATGVWHGAHWNFIVWGLMNGFIIILSIECKPLYERFHKRFDVKNTLYFRSFQVLRTFLLMSALRMFDCYKDVPLTFKMFGTMFTNWNIDELFSGTMLELGVSVMDYIIIVIGIMIMLGVSLIQRKGSVRDQIFAKPRVLRYVVVYTLLFGTLLLGAYGFGYDASQFIYNQF